MASVIKDEGYKNAIFNGKSVICKIKYMTYKLNVNIE